jgi:death-on-curing protein
VAFDLCRLLVANHPFVDGNKRTALNTVAVLYARNGRRFDYDDEVRSILKRFRTDASALDREAVIEYLREATEGIEPVEEPVRELARADREAHRGIYDALATE